MYLTLGIILTGGLGIYANRKQVIKKTSSFVWESLYVIDKCSKLFNKIKNDVSDLFNTKHELITYTNNVLSTTSSNIKNIKELQKYASDNYLLILSSKKKQNDGSNQFHMQRITLDSDLNKESKISKIMFYGTSIRILENKRVWAKYPMELCFDSYGTKYNYMISNNILFDKLFVHFWLKYYHNIILSNNQTYEIEFLDDTMETIKLTESSYIRLNEKDYNIIFNSIDKEPFEL